MCSQARAGSGGKTYTYCYTHDDPESHVSFSTAVDKSFFHSVCSSVRRIFHRKVRRQKESEEGDAQAELGTGDASKAEGKLAWMTEEQRHNGSSGGGGGGKMIKLCCNTGSSDDRVKRDDYIPVPAPAASAREQAPKRLTRAFQNSPPGYIAVLTEEEENNGRCGRPRANAVIEEDTDLKHNHYRPSDVSEHSVNSAGNGQTVVEVNSAGGKGADEEPQSSLPLPSTASLEVQVTGDRGRVMHPRSDSAEGGAVRDVAGDNGCAAAEVSGVRSDNVIGRGFFRKDRLSKVDRRLSEPVAQSQEYRRERKMSQTSAGSSHRPVILDGAPPGDLELFLGHAHRRSPCIRVDSASTIDSGGSDYQASEHQLPSPSSLLHPHYLPRSVSIPLDDSDSDSDIDADDVVYRCRSNSAPNIVALAHPGSSVHLPPPCAGVRLSPTGSSVAVGAIAASPSAKRVGLFQRYCVL